MNIFKSHLCLLFFMLSYGLELKAQEAQLWQRMGVGQGLIDDFVECITEDSRGFLWVGTWSGISRYDGKNFTHFRKGSSDSSGLPGSWVYTIVEDNRGTIWVGTDEGLAVFSRWNNQFLPLKIPNAHAIVSICQSPDGTVWAAGDRFVYQWDVNSFRLLYKKEFKSPSLEIGAITIDEEMILWLGTSQAGLKAMHASSKKMLSVEPLINNQLAAFNIKHIRLEKPGRLLLGTWDGGIFLVHTKFPVSVQRLQHQENEPGSLANNRVSVLQPNKDGSWSVMSPQGTHARWQPGDKNVKHLPAWKETFSSNGALSLSCYWVDRLGNEWVGTHGNGLFQRNLQKEKLQHIGTSDEGNKISCFLTLPDKKVLVGSDGNGLFLYDPVRLEFKALDLGKKFKFAKVLDMKLGTQEECWISCWSNGIVCLDTRTWKVKKHFDGKSGDPRFSCSDIKGIYLEDSLLWIASNGEGVFQYNTYSGKFTDRSTRTPFDFSIPRWGNSITKDSHGRFWISSSKGLYAFDGSRLRHFTAQSPKQDKISSNFVVSVLEDAQKNIWAITEEGLDKWSEEQLCFIPWRTKGGYSLKQIRGITQDELGRYWISTQHGIACLNLNTNECFRFDSYCPSGITFYHQAAISLPNGQIGFGTLNGWVVFHPKHLLCSPSIPDISFTELPWKNKRDDSVTIFKNEREGRTSFISLDYTESPFTVSFVAPDLSDVQGLQYVYTLDGQSSPWQELGSRNSITFSNLAPGSYELQVKAKNNVGEFSKEPATLQIEVIPPWYRTHLAYLMYLLISMVLLYLTYRIVIFRIRMRNKLLIQQYQYQKELELYQSKIEFFTNLSHDIRTPLTLILAPLELLRAKISSNVEALKMVDTMDRNARRLLSLVDELLTFRRLESGERSLDKSEVQVEKLVEQSLENFRNEASLKSIQVVPTMVPCKAWLDEILISKLLDNLLGNAFKFTPREGTVNVQLIKEDHEFKLKIANSGSNIPDAVLQHLFDPFYSKEPQKGYGLGLAISKEIVEQHQGRIYVENINDNVVFTIQLPLAL
ncbi:MAG: ATP-binding protein [Cytophagaceae bacterium]|nr:ATP-binding protein [Cytophagaceae bacterium]